MKETTLSKTNKTNKNKKELDEEKTQLIDYISSNLTVYEQGELFNEFKIDDIYFTGHIHKKINKETHYNLNRYDELIYNANLSDRYKIIMGDHINYRYEIMYELGKGVYGNVVKVLDHKTQSKAALKIYKNSHFYNKANKREINILKLVKEYYCDDRDYVLLIQDSFIFRNHYCMISNLYGLNLYDNRYEIKYFTFLNKLQIIKDLFHGMEFLKNGCGEFTIIHGDIKPENIFMKSRYNYPEVIIGDFGLSKKITKGTHYFKDFILQSLHYKAPEIYFKIPFNETADIWSIGCIIYEIFCGDVLIPAKKDRDQMIFTHQILGEPNKDYIKSHPNIQYHYSNYKSKFLQDAYYITRLPSSNLKLDEKNFILQYSKQYKLNNTDSTIKNMDFIEKESTFIINLVHKCLVYEQEKRITPLGGIDYINYVKHELEY